MSMWIVTVDRVVEDPEEGEEGEEGELAAAPQGSADGIKSEEGEDAMDIDGQGQPLWLVC